jgi:hypothetical protein
MIYDFIYIVNRRQQSFPSNWLVGRVVMVPASSSNPAESSSNSARIESGSSWAFHHWSINYMMLPNNRSTLGSNKTGVYTVPHQSVDKCRKA